jgi:hypothetical protein
MGVAINGLLALIFQIVGGEDLFDGLGRGLRVGDNAPGGYDRRHGIEDGEQDEYLFTGNQRRERFFHHKFFPKAQTMRLTPTLTYTTFISIHHTPKRLGSVGEFFLW